MFPSKAGTSDSTLRVLSLPVNIRLGWKRLIVTNTLAYCGAEIVTTVKSFTVEETGDSVD